MSDDLTGLALALAAINERLERIEERLGMTEPTPLQARMDAWANEGDA